MQHLRLEDFDAVAFDVEGTLADTIPTHHLARYKAFEEHGHGHVTREQHELGPTYGSSTADIVGGVLHAAGIIEKTSPFREHPVVQDVMTTKTRYFGEIAREGFEQMPGAINFLKLLYGHFGQKTVLVTSSPERFVMPFLAKYDVSKLFLNSHIITQDTVEALGLEGKPAPDPYLLAKERLQSTRLLVIEDTASGVESAKRAGATVLALGFEKHSTALFKAGDLPYPPDIFAADYTHAQHIFGLDILHHPR